MGNIKFTWNPTGYQELKNSEKVQSLITEKAERVKARANASLSTGGYTAIDDFEIYTKTNSKDNTDLKIVVTHSEHAKRAQNKHKTLTNALGSANGGQ